MKNIQDAQAIQNQLLLNEIFQAFFLDEALNQQQTQFLQENFQCINDYLERPLDSPEDIKFKQMLAKILVIAKQRGILPSEIQNELPQSCENETKEQREERLDEVALKFAGMVEDATDRSKVAYKVRMGEIAVDKAIDRMIDKGAAKASLFLDKAIDKGIQWAITKGSVTLSAMFPVAAPAIAVASTFLKKAAPVIREGVKIGVKKVADKAKDLCHKVVHEGAKVVGRVLHKAGPVVSRGIKKIGSWFKV